MSEEDRGKHLGRMDNGVTDCGLIVMSRWDQPDWDDNKEDRDRFIRELRSRGFSHKKLDRYEHDPMPQWVGESECGNDDCQCHKWINKA
jgi:hypothetical protein